MTNFLNQSISHFAGVSTTISYIFPKIGNVDAGVYTSEIMNVEEVLNDDGSLDALDFYHQLTDNNGNVIYVRFRYYAKDLPGLARELSKYPHVQTWQNTVGLQEEVVVSKKATGNYMYISSRKALMLNTSQTTTSSTATSASCSSVPKKGGLATRSSRYPIKKSATTQRQALLDEDDSEFDGFFDDEIEE